LDTLFLLVLFLGVFLFGLWNLTQVYGRMNELSAITLLQLVGKAEEQYKGQHGFYSLIKALPPTSLPKELPRQESPVVSFRGYAVRVFLQEAEPGNRGPTGMPSQQASWAGTRWSAYAWPEEYGWTGRRSFFINESGRIYSGEDAALTGRHPKKLTAGLACMKGDPSQDVDTTRWEPLGQ
jgi:hypothetical protein